MYKLQGITSSKNSIYVLMKYLIDNQYDTDFIFV